MKKLLPFLLLFVFMVSCSDDDSPTNNNNNNIYNLAYLHSNYIKGWQLDSMYVDGVAEELESYEHESVMFFFENGNGIYVYSEDYEFEEGEDEVGYDDYQWSQSGDSLFINYINGERTDERYKITEFTNERIVLEGYIPFFDMNIRAVLGRVVVPDPSAGTNNKYLTNGESKIWISDSLWHDGASMPLKDEYAHLVIFNTDGTGIMVKEATYDDGTENMQNDKFTWSFNENQSRIEIEEYEHGHFFFEEYLINDLTPQAFYYENYKLIGANNVLVQIKRVPYFTPDN